MKKKNNDDHSRRGTTDMAEDSRTAGADLVITGGLTNIRPRPRQVAPWPQMIRTACGAVGCHVIHHEMSARYEPGLLPVAFADPHDDLWLYVFHGAYEFIGCFRCERLTADSIAKTAEEFARTTSQQDAEAWLAEREAHIQSERKRRGLVGQSRHKPSTR